jgi:hypothetical protein
MATIGRFISKETREKFGGILCLWSLLNEHTPSSWDGFGQAQVDVRFSDRELAYALHATQREIAGWRNELANLGLLQWSDVPDGSRVFWVNVPAQVPKQIAAHARAFCTH